MKRIFYIALLQILGAALGGAADKGKSLFRHPVAAHFGACPDGHEALVDVPVVYGLVGPLFKKPADYDDEDQALKLKEEKGQIVFGGCAFGPQANTRVVCRQCGFYYDSMDVPEEFLPENVPVMAWWMKSAKSPDEFRITFGETLLSLPQLKPVQGSIRYSQSLSANGKELDAESVSYRTSLTFDEALKAMRQWLAGDQRNPADLKPLPLEPVPSPPADPFFSPPNVANPKVVRSETATGQGSKTPAVDPFSARDVTNSKGENTGPAAAQDTPGQRAYKYDDRTVWLTLRDDWYWNPGQVEISLRIEKDADEPVKPTANPLR